MNLEEIYEAHSKMVFNLALQYVQNIQEAEEITQDVFLSVHDKKEQFKSESTLKTWIYRIAINKSLDHIKARKRKKRWSLFTAKNIDDQKHLSDFNHPGVDLEQKESVAHIFKGINQLPENQKTALILLKIDGLTMKEAAEIMQVTPKAIESLFQRAKKNLAVYLNESEGK